MKTFFLFISLFFVAFSGSAQGNECASPIIMGAGAGYCTFQSGIVTSGATASSQPAQVAGAADDDVWYRFTSQVSADPDLRTVVWFRVTDLVFTAGTPGIVVELWNDCEGTAAVDHYISSATTSDSIAFRNLLPNRNYLLRIYTQGNTSRITSGNICLKYPCRNPNPGDQCQGGYGIGAEANDACQFSSTFDIPPGYPEFGCYPFAIRSGNTLFATGDGGMTPSIPGSADDDVWYTIETNDINRHIVKLSEVVAVKPGTKVVCEWWNVSCNTMVAASPAQDVATEMSFEFSTPTLQKNTVYKVRIYTEGSGAQKGLRGFKICYLTSHPDNDDPATATIIPLSTVSCTFSPADPFFFSHYGATPSVQTSPGNTADKDDDLWYRFTTGASIRTVRLTFNQPVWLDYAGSVELTAEIWEASTNTYLYTLQLRELLTTGNMLATGLNPSSDYLVRVYTPNTTNRLWKYKLCLLAIPTPAYDDCNTAQALPVSEGAVLATCTPSATLYSTEGAQASAQAPSAGFPDDADDDTWFSFTTTANTNARVQLTDFTYLALTQGMVAELWSADCNTRIREAIFLTGATEYTFIFNGLMASTGYKLRLYSKSNFPAARVISFRICVQLSGAAPANDHTSGASPVTFNHRNATVGLSVGSFSTAGATESVNVGEADCAGLPANRLNDVFLSFIPLSSSLTLTLEGIAGINGTDPSLGMAVYRKDELNPLFVPVSGGCAIGNTLALDNKLLIGSQYFLRVFNAVPGNESSFTVKGRIPLAPSNDVCANAILLSSGVTYPSVNWVDANSLHSSAGTEALDGSCSNDGAANSDLWFKIVNPGLGEATRILLKDVERVNNIGDPDATGSTTLMWALYSGNCGSLEFLSCGTDYDTRLNTPSGLGTYYLRVYSYDKQSQMKFKIALETNIISSNVSCASAITLTPTNNIEYENSGFNRAIAYNGNTIYGQSDVNDCMLPYPTPGVWYKFTPIFPTHYLVLEGLERIEGASGEFPDVAYRLYKGNECGTLEEIACKGSFLAEGGKMTGLVVGEPYYLRIQKNFNSAHVKFRASIGSAGTEGFEPQDEPNNNIRYLIHSPICNQNANFTQVTAKLTASPAASDLAMDNMVIGDTWLRFRASTQTAVLNFYQFGKGMGIALYNNDLDNLLVDYLPIPADGRITLPATLTIGTTYVVRVYKSMVGANFYSLCITGLPANTIASTPFSACTTSDEGTVRFTNAGIWRHFTKGGNLVASILDNLATLNLGDVTMKYYLNPPPVLRAEGGISYLDRNFGIDRTGTINGFATLMFYLSKDELDRLVEANGISSRPVYYLNDLGVWRLPSATCDALIAGSDRRFDRIQKFGLLPGSQDVYYIQYETNSFSGFFIGNFMEGGVLPVRCKSFTAIPSAKRVNLQWTTASEARNKGFTIERSPDGANFSPVAFVPASTGTGLQGEKNYTWQDGTLKTGGNYFYRLQQEDLDGRKEYVCGVQQVKLISDYAATVYPNPAKNELFVKTEESGGSASFTILDMKGRQLLSGSIPAGSANARLSLAQIPAGLYIVSILQDGKTTNHKVVKQ